MWTFDENDPLDRLLLQEARGTPVDFLQWERMEEALEEEPDAADSLRANGYTVERGLREGEVFRAEFLRLLERYGLPADDRLGLCYRLATLATEDTSDGLIYLTSALLADCDFLLSRDRAEYQSEMGAWSYVDAIRRTADYFCKIKHRRAMLERFRALLPELQSKHSRKVTDDIPRADAVFQAYLAAFSPDRDETLFRGNLEALLQLSAASPALHTVEPLFLYQAVTRHDKRLHSTETLSINFRALWKRKDYQITRDNGKNFRDNRARLCFFSKLCELYANDDSVDTALSLYGFDCLSNLGAFYREEIAWENFPYPPKLRLDLPETVEELIFSHAFQCYEGGGRNCFVEQDRKLTDLKIEAFREEEQYRHAFRKIDDYINRRQGEIAKAFWQADDSAVKALCRSILENAEIPARHRPRDLQEVSLFLAAINEVLLELVANFADRLLELTVRIFTGEAEAYTF